MQLRLVWPPKSSLLNGQPGWALLGGWLVDAAPAHHSRTRKATPPPPRSRPAAEARSGAAVGAATGEEIHGELCVF